MSDSTVTDRAPRASPAPTALRYAPHVAVFAVGYVVFTYAAVPDYVASRYHTGLTGVGFLMSAALVSFVLTQAVADRVGSRWTTTQALLGLLVVHAAFAVVLDLVASLAAVLVLRFLWGLAGGLVLSLGATHVARVNTGGSGTRQQGIYGGMLTLGGAFGFLVAKPLVAATGGFGVHALGAAIAVPAFLMLWPYRHGTRTAAQRTTDVDVRRVLRNPTVLVAAFGYAATLGAYITLSTFITSYFTDLGVTGPLNAAVLTMATIARLTGGGIGVRLGLSDDTVVTLTTGVGAAAFLGLLVDARLVALSLPLVAMVAICLPFGAVFNLGATATSHQSAALGVVVGLGNVAAVVLPTVTGVLRTETGGYGAVFVLLAAILALAGVSAHLVTPENALGD